VNAKAGADACTQHAKGRVMKQFLLAATLIGVAVILFVGGRMYGPWATNAAVLGNLTPLQSIVTDVQTIAKSGDMAAAVARITDLETA
jgi:hypothetical protein